jgi:hypothetical protein
MKKQPLSVTNPYLQNPEWKQRMLQVSAQTSTEVEQIDLTTFPRPSNHLQKGFKGDTAQGSAE